MSAKRARELCDKFHSVQSNVQDVLNKVEIACRAGNDELWFHIGFTKGSGKEHLLDPVTHSLRSLGYTVEYSQDGEIIDLKW